MIGDLQTRPNGDTVNLVCNRADTGLRTGMESGYTESRRGSIGGDLQALRPLSANSQPVLPTTGLCSINGFCGGANRSNGQCLAGMRYDRNKSGFRHHHKPSPQTSPIRCECVTPIRAVPIRKADSRVFLVWLGKTGSSHPCLTSVHGGPRSVVEGDGPHVKIGSSHTEKHLATSTLTPFKPGRMDRKPLMDSVGVESACQEATDADSDWCVGMRLRARARTGCPKAY